MAELFDKKFKSTAMYNNGKKAAQTEKSCLSLEKNRGVRCTMCKSNKFFKRPFLPCLHCLVLLPHLTPSTPVFAQHPSSLDPTPLMPPLHSLPIYPPKASPHTPIHFSVITLTPPPTHPPPSLCHRCVCECV